MAIFYPEASESRVTLEQGKPVQSNATRHRARVGQPPTAGERKALDARRARKRAA